jgi:hypothetical protein
MTRSARKGALAALSVVAATGLSACEKQIEAPTDRGVCWHMVYLQGGKTRFNKLTENVGSIERCAGDLEAMRLRFNALGQSNEHMVGAFQGQFLFLQPEGIFTSQTLTGGRYLLLVRTGDGRLAKPGVMPVQ